MAGRIKAAIRKTNLAFLWDVEGRPWKLRADTKGSTHGTILGGSFLRCLSGSRTLAIGTEGLLFEFPEYRYSQYVWINGESWPAKGSTRTLIKTFYVFVALVSLEDGTEVVAECCETRMAAQSKAVAA